MMRLDSRTAKELVNKIRSLLQEKSYRVANNVRNKVNSVMDPQAAANGAVVNKKLISVREWYEEFTGIDQVRAAQERVVVSESKFISAQEARRQASKKLIDIQNKLREIYGELEKTRRGEDRYIFLVTREHNLMKEEEVLTTHFQQFEQEEREHFSILSSAVKESHEKERLQAERTKYWSIIGSILGTVLGVVGSTINNRYKMNEFRSILTQAVSTDDKIEVLAERLGNAVKNATPVQAAATDSKTGTSKLDLDHFYSKVVSEFDRQEQIRRERENILMGAAFTAGATFLIYRLLF